MINASDENFGHRDFILSPKDLLHFFDSLKAQAGNHRSGLC
jgi:hypothetical protein